MVGNFHGVQNFVNFLGLLIYKQVDILISKNQALQILLLLLLLAAVNYNQVQPLRINYLAS